MNRFKTFIGFRAALLLLSLSAPLYAQTAAAQDQPAPAKKERKANGSMSEATYRSLEKIYKLMGDNKNGEALEKLQELLERVSSSYEKCLVLQTMGYVYANQNNYKKAIDLFQQALDLEGLPQQPYEQLLYNIGQMYVATEQYDKGIAMVERYLAEATTPPPPDAHILLASAYAEKKRFRDALTHVDIALGSIPKPKEQWLQLKLALHYELKEYPKCAETLVQLISVAPVKKDYWKQLSSIFFELKQDKESLAVLALADRQGFINEEREFRNLANIYMLLEIPYKAALTLQRGFEQKALKEDEKTLLSLADAWFLAREYDKSEIVLKKAAELTGKGDIYFRLAQLYIEDERWKKALETLDQALKKGTSKAGEASFLAGVAAYQTGDKSKARRELQKATQYDNSRKSAQQWLAFIEQQDPVPVQTAQGGVSEEKPSGQKPARKN